MEARPDIGGFDKPVINTEDEDECDLSDKQQTKEKCQALDRFLAAPLESIIIDVIDTDPDKKKRRRHDDPDQDRIDAEIGIESVGDKRAEHDERGVGDIDDVEHAEGDRHANCDRGIEAAEQEPGDDRVDRQVERDHPRRRPAAASDRIVSRFPPRRCNNRAASTPSVKALSRRTLDPLVMRGPTAKQMPVSATP